MGPAGMTLVIAKNAFLDGVKHPLPSMSDYRIFRDNQSMFNTPSVFSIYVAMLNLIWLKSNSRVEGIEIQNKKKAELLYTEIDRNELFKGTANVAHRSRMNIPFKTPNAEMEQEFLKFAADRGMAGIKGYRTLGGFRASLYNALSLTSVQGLIEAMKEYEKLKQSLYFISCRIRLNNMANIKAFRGLMPNEVLIKDLLYQKEVGTVCENAKMLKRSD